MHNVTKKELINEIDTVLARNDISHKDFVILHSLRYLIEDLENKEQEKIKYGI